MDQAYVDDAFSGLEHEVFRGRWNEDARKGLARLLGLSGDSRLDGPETFEYDSRLSQLCSIYSALEQDRCIAPINKLAVQMLKGYISRHPASMANMPQYMRSQLVPKNLVLIEGKIGKIAERRVKP